MDILEQMVNNHADAARNADKRNAARNRRVQKHLNRVCLSAAVAIVFLLFDLMGLVHTALAVPVMLIALMVGFYSLGRCVRFGMRVC